jgi:hypothetical protein
MFGINELILKPKSKSGYKDVYPLQRKKACPWQAKVWDAARQSRLVRDIAGSSFRGGNGTRDWPRESAESRQNTGPTRLRGEPTACACYFLSL